MCVGQGEDWRRFGLGGGLEWEEELNGMGCKGLIWLEIGFKREAELEPFGLKVSGLPT